MDYVQLEKDMKTVFRNIDHCNEQVDVANDKIDRVAQEVSDILALLQGSTLNKQDVGFIGMVLENRRRLEKLEKFKDRVIWIIIGMSLTSGYAISDIISRLINKH